MEKLIVSRKWTNPAITVKMSTEEIAIEMEADAYLEAIVNQITNLSITFTKATLLAKLKDAHANVVVEMKKSTVQVV
jgi:hypothetical protein